MKLIQCSECGEVIMKLAKGSEIKPDIYSSHESAILPIAGIWLMVQKILTEK